MPVVERWTATFAEATAEEESVAFTTGEEIAIRLKHSYRDDVAFEFTLLCEAAAPTMMGSSKNNSRSETIWSRSGSAMGGSHCQISFFIPNSFMIDAAEAGDTWGLSITSASTPANPESGVWAKWTHKNLHVQWPPPSLSVGSRLSQRYFVEYSVRISATRVPKDGRAKERLSGKDVILPFKLWAGEPLDYLLSAGPSPSITLQPTKSISMDAHIKAFRFYLRKLHTFSASREYQMEFLFPQWILLNDPIQIPYKIQALTEAWQNMPRKVECRVTAWFTEYLDFRLSASKETETKVVNRVTKAFSVVHTIDKPTISGCSPRFTLTPNEILPTFHLRGTKGGQASGSFNGEISFYCKVRIVCNIDQKIIGAIPTLRDSWNEEFSMNALLLPPYYSSFMSTTDSLFRPPSTAGNLVYPQRGQGSSDAPPPDYDTLSIRSVRTLPQYDGE